MSIGNEQAKVKVDLDTAAAEARLQELGREARELRKTIKLALDGGFKEGAAAAQKQLEAVQKEMDNVRASIDHVSRVMKNLNGASIKDLTKAQVQLTMQIKNASRATAEERVELDRKSAKLREIKNRIRELNLQYLDITQDNWNEKFARFFNTYSQGIFMVTAMISGFAYSVSNFLRTSGEVTDQLAKIQKTTGMTVKEVENLNNAFKRIDTRTSMNDLRQIAIIGGQLGVAKEDILSFTKSINMLSVALGDEFKGGSDEIANTLGKLRNVLTDRRTANIGEDLLRIGNALNILGAEGMATGDVVSDFATRIGGIGIPLGMTTPQVLGLSAALQEMGVSTERGATAVTKILQKMARETKTFARIAGMEYWDFYNLVNTNITEAFLKVAEGAKNSGREATQLSEIIKELEVQGAGAAEVFAKVGQNIDLVRDKIQTSSYAIKNSSSITKEYNIMNETLGAKLDRLGKEFNRLITSSVFTNFARSLTDALIALVNWFKNLPEFISKYSVAINSLITITAAYIAVSKKDIAINLWRNLILKEGIGLRIKEAVVLKASIVQEQVLLAWRSKTTLATKLAAAAAALFNNTLAMHPIGWVVLAIGGLITALKAYEKYNYSVLYLEEKKYRILYQIKNAIDQTKDAYQNLSDQIEKFNILSSEEKTLLVEKTKARINDLKARYEELKWERNFLFTQSKHLTLTQKIWQGLTHPFGIGGNLSDVVDEKAYEKATEAVKEHDEQLADLGETIKTLETEYGKLSELFYAEQRGDAIGTETQEMLQEKLRYYQTALKNTKKFIEGTSEVSADYERILKKVIDVQNLLKEYDIEFTDDDGGKKSFEKKQKEWEKYLKFVEDMYKKIRERIKEHNQFVDRMQMDQFDKEIALIKEKYEKDLEFARLMMARLGTNPVKNAKELTKWTLVYSDLMKAMNDEIASKEFEQAEQIEQKKLEIRKKYGIISLEEEREKELLELNKLYKGALLSYDDYLKAIRDVNRKYDSEEFQKWFKDKYSLPSKYDLLTVDEEEEKELTDVDGQVISGEIKSVEDAEMIKEKIREKYRKIREENDKEATKKYIDRIQEEVEKAQLIIQSYSDFLSSLKELELTQAGDNEEKKKKIAKKYADIEMGMTISRIIADTAASIIKAQAQLGVFALPAQILMGATGAVQVGVAIAERNKILSLEKGGYTGAGIGFNDYEGKEIAGVVHPDEYVIPAWERKIPMVANFERIIEAIRQNRGFLNGGQTTKEIIKSEPVYMASPELISSINKLNELLMKGIDAKLIANEEYLKVHNKAQKKLSEIKYQTTA